MLDWNLWIIRQSLEYPDVLQIIFTYTRYRDKCRNYLLLNLEEKLYVCKVKWVHQFHWVHKKMFLWWAYYVGPLKKKAFILYEVLLFVDSIEMTDL
jgi:hypothetical protein